MTPSDLIGRKSPEFIVPLERGAIRAFAAATGSSNPDYLERKDAVIPPFFLTTGPAFWGYSLEAARDSQLADLGFDPTAMLHGEEAHEFPSGPPRAGTELRAVSEIVDAYFKTRRTGEPLFFVVLETVYRDEQSRIVARCRTTAVRVGTP
jgi:hypothetical protein